MEQMEQMEQKGLGNTSSRPPPKKARKWCFTLNNYTVPELEQMTKEFKIKKMKYIVGEEVGAQGTPHLQGYIECKNPVSFNTIKKIIPKGHIELARGSTKQNYEYCSKDNKYHTNIDVRSKQEKLKDIVLDNEYKEVKWHKWQQDVLELISGTPDKRKINWIWEPKGNVGKSYLCKYIALTQDVIICEGKKNDVFNQVNIALEKGKIPRIIICDIPRSAMEYLNYGCLEQLKNGMMYSGKYEGGQCIFPIPHVVCFANTPPKEDEMSEDRWNIIELQ